MQNNIIPAGGGYQNGEVSPFDEIKHTDEHGDWWSSRELMPLYGYERWQNFAACIERAKAVADTNGQDVTRLFTAVSKKTGGRPLDDFKLRRHAAYLVAMEGDGSKPEIAAAKHYFATRTQDAELIDGMDRELRMIVEGAMELQRTRNELRQVQQIQVAQGERQEQIEARVATLEGNHDWVSALGYARMHPPLCTDQRYLARVGRVASRMARQQGVQVGKTSHPYFGEANTYPGYILEAAFSEVGAA